MAEQTTAQITKQPVLNIGIVGHIDHGKTTLLYQLTGVWADKHSEELKRGITIKLGYADVVIRKCEKCGKFTIKKECACGGVAKEVRYVSFVDAPGHEMLMATMLGGAAIIDAALLVIAANEPFPQPQTKEHLLALEAKGIKQVIIVQNKLDLVTKEQALKQYEEIKEFIKGTIAKDATVVPICAQQGINIDALFEIITELQIPPRDTESKPLFLIARSFDVNLPGTKPQALVGGILGGILKKGKLKIGDEIEIKPGLAIKKHDKTEYKTIKTKILGLRTGHNVLEEALPSGSLAIQTSLDPFLTKSDALAGCIAGLQGTLPEIVYSIKLKTTVFKKIVGAKEEIKIEPLKTGEYLMLSINTTITLGIVTKIKDNEIELNLKIPIVPFKGERVGIARNYQGHWRLIGWGELL
ncbi:MAG: translation initiation factor IF-2 subunit gamma [Candidatus Pacearchaeota archaeon]|nr:translation initiation factor IF-2 subunit gamma [Candidatus Pacearchaeota archaeon]